MIRGLSVLVLGATLAIAPVAAAQPWRDGARGAARVDRSTPGENAQRAGRLIPLTQIIEQIRRREPGRLLNAGLEQGDRPVYRVRWASDDGRRVDYLVDAESGQVLAAE